MGSDLRSIFRQAAPAPRASLDVESVIRQGARRRATRAVAYVATTLTVAALGLLFVPDLVGDDRRDQPGPVASNEGSPQQSSPSPSPDSSAPTPVFENLGPGWTRLTGPPEARTEGVAVWSGRTSSGRDLFSWGGYSGSGGTVHESGYSWDPDTNQWSPIADSPLEPRAGAGAVFTGREIIIWGGYGAYPKTFSDGAAYDPESDTWRLLPEAPIPAAVPVATVWTGDEVIVWGSTDRSDGSRGGAAYNPNTDQWRRLPDAPAAINEGTAVWADGDPSQRHEMIVFGAQLDNNNASELDHAIGIAYDPQTDSWRELPDVALSPQASSIAWTGETLIAWDYGLRAAEYDRRLNEWSSLPRVPLQDSECYPVSALLGSTVFAWFCGEAALWDPSEREWQRIETPEQIVPGVPVAAGHVLLFVGATHESTHNSLWIYPGPPGKE